MYVILYDFSVSLSDPKWYPARQALKLDPSEYTKTKNSRRYLYRGLRLYYMAVGFNISFTIITTRLFSPAILISVSLEITKKIFQDLLFLSRNGIIKILSSAPFQPISKATR